MERAVDFVACDLPSANAFMLHVYAAVAQEERRMISERTRVGLAAAKARGVVLGCPRFPEINAARRAAAIERAQAIAPMLAEYADLSARATAAELNARRDRDAERCAVVEQDGRASARTAWALSLKSGKWEYFRRLSPRSRPIAPTIARQDDLTTNQEGTPTMAMRGRKSPRPQWRTVPYNRDHRALRP